MSTIIEGYTAGDDLDIERDVTGITVTDPLVKAWLTIKTSASVLDASATLQKIITTVQVIGTGQITQDGSVTNGNGTASMVFNLTAVDTALLGITLRYFYDVQVKTSSGKIYTPDKGSIKLDRAYTDATT
jgi:hypothetical protein